MQVRIYKQENGKVAVGVYHVLHREGRTKLVSGVAPTALKDTLRTLVRGMRAVEQLTFPEVPPEAT